MEWRVPGDLHRLLVVAKDILEELKAVRALLGPPAAVRLVSTASLRDEKGKPVAQQGAHDDMVFARALAYYAREVDLGHRDPVFAGAEEYGEEDENERPS